MSRFYHALNDPRRCMKCKTACAIFGQRDPETSWHYWCTLCNRTWHNRRIENTLFAVSRNFAKHSIATLAGSENNALAILAFLQISIDCIRYNYDLRHQLEIQVLEARWHGISNQIVKQKCNVSITLSYVRYKKPSFAQQPSRQLAFHALLVTNHGRYCMRYALL